MKRIVLILPVLLIVTLFTPRCAKVVAPTGGPRDTIPPVTVRTSPPMYSTNFKDDRVTITFDEFIKLNDIMQKMVLSPPQEQLPEFVIRGKRLDFRFYEPLRENTTYTLYLSNAVVDNNEGNEIPNLQLAFSTGSEIDTLSLSGIVIDAFTLDSVEGALVMLYQQMDDSLPMTELPQHVTKTNEAGSFTLNNIGKQEYKMFVLDDQNRNYLFDQITERIAFYPNAIADTMLQPRREPQDTLPIAPEAGVTLRMFEEQNPVQALTDFERKHRRSIELGFTREPEGEVSIKPLGFDGSDSWYIFEQNLKGDTLRYWITNDSISSIDTLSVAATYQKTDSLYNFYTSTDTLRVFYIPKQEPQRRSIRGRDDVVEPKTPTIKVKSSHSRNEVVYPHQNFSFLFPIPLIDFNPDLISVMELKDSTYIQDYSVTPDTLSTRRYHLEYPWAYNVRYEISALPGAFIDLDSLTNDTLSYSVRGANPEDYGTINLKVDRVTPDIIVDLMSDAGRLVDRKTIESDTTITFSYVKPGTYSFRFIDDVNRNGEWDTGKYIEGRQPERVTLWMEGDEPWRITIRANWEYNENYTIIWPTDF